MALLNSTLPILRPLKPPITSLKPQLIEIPKPLSCTPSLTQSFSSVKDLQNWMSETIKQMTEKFQETVSELQNKYDQLLQKHIQLEKKYESSSVYSEKIATALTKVALYVDQLAEVIEKNELAIEAYDGRFKLIDVNLENLKHDVLLTQYRDLQHAIRIRGLAENSKENVKQVITNVLMNVLNCGPEIYYELESAFRINSWIAYQRNFPRDIMVYFTTKLRRNEVMQIFYQQRFKILNQDVVFLKEIPAQMLQERRNYAFLTQELKKRQITYKWGVPLGIKITLNGKFYKINSIKEANNFMDSVLQVNCSFTPHNTDSTDQPANTDLSDQLANTDSIDQLANTDLTEQPVSTIVIEGESSGVAGKCQGWKKKSRTARKKKQKGL